MTATNPAAVDDRSAAIIAGLSAIQPQHVLILPSSTLKAVVGHFLEAPDGHTFPIPREEEGVGILAGLVLAGQRAVMIIQDNGIGNLLTALPPSPRPTTSRMLDSSPAPRRPRRIQLDDPHRLRARRAAARRRRRPLLPARRPHAARATGRRPSTAPTSTPSTTHRPVFLLVNLMGG